MVSILVPVYNAAPYLRECVGSLIGQTYTDLQIVMINDGSKDESWEVLQELAKQDKRIEIYSQTNCGVAATRNRLLDKVRGDFVLFVDSDDWIELNTIELLMREQGEGDYDIVAYQLSQLKPRNEYYNQEQIIKKFLEHNTFRGSLCDKLVKADLYKGLGIDPSVSYGEDALLIWQVLQRVKKVCVIGEVLYHYRENVDSLSRQHFNGKKFTAYTTWDYISRDTEELWPQYKDLAKARFACEMAQILRSGAMSGYRYDNSVRLLQEEVHRDGHLIRKTRISSIKMSLLAWLVSHSYWLTCRLSRFLK